MSFIDFEPGQVWSGSVVLGFRHTRAIVAADGACARSVGAVRGDLGVVRGPGGEDAQSVVGEGARLGGPDDELKR